MADAPAPGDVIEPTAPVVEPVTPVVEPTADEAQQAAEDAEWQDAAKELFPGLDKPKTEEKTDGTAKPETTTQTTAATPENPDDKKPDAEQGDGNDTQEEDGSNQPSDPEAAARAARAAARQSAQVVDEIKVDIRKQMFADAPTELKDADGDPIKGIDDVMKLRNPRTGVAFTEEEAGMWLLSAQQQFNQQVASTDKQIEQIADVALTIKDEADSVAYEYGEILKAMPELRDEIWADYQETLQKDAKTGIITKAPISLKKFYDRQLKPYVDKALALEDTPAVGALPAAPGTPAPAAPPAPTDPAAAKAAADAAKAAKRADRSDIYTAGKANVTDPEEDEWAAAATEVFGPIK